MVTMGARANRSRSALATAVMGLAALLSAAGPAGRSPGPGPTTRPTRPVVDREALHKLVDGLASPQYRVRRAARDGLEKVVEIPGAAEVLQARLTRAKDAQVRATLQSLLTGFDQPIAMVWYRGGLRELPQAAPAPWLFIQADGRFVYDAKSPLLGGKAGPEGDCRQGKLPAARLLALKRTIAASGLAIGPSSNRPARYVSGMAQVTLYLRAGQSMRQGSFASPLE